MSKIYVYLDDLRIPPPGWFLVRTAKEAIEILSTNKVNRISLDHDLGEVSAGTGVDVLNWIEARVHEDKSFILPEILIHSQNPVGKSNMDRIIKSIFKFKGIDNE